MKKKIDPYFALLLGALVVWWLIAGGLKTSASQIASLQSGSNPKAWIRALSGPDRTVRDFARIHILERSQSQQLGELAILEVESESAGRQLAGLWLLSKVDLPGRGKVAAKFLDAPTADLKQAALDVLAQDPSPETHDALLKLANDEDESIQASAISALAAIGDSNDLDLFVGSLGHGSPSVREAARNGILKISKTGPSVTTKLLNLVGAADPTAAREVVELLGEMKRPDTLDGLFYYLEFGSPGLTMDIAKAIGKIDGDAARAKSLDAFRNGSSRTRRGVAKVLKELGYKAAAPDLLATALDPSEEFWLRYYAMEALSTCGTPECIPLVNKLIEDKADDLRLLRIALESLGGMDSDQVLGIYDRVIDGKEDFGLDADGGQTALLSVIAGLGHMDTDASRQRLRDLLGRASTEDTEVTTQVVRSLGEVGIREDIDLLKEAKLGRMMLRTPVDDAVDSIEERYPETDKPE